MNSLKNILKNCKGAAMVEFAIVLPLLLLLIFGMIEFGFLFYNKAMITNASREGAREGILYSFPNRISVDQITSKVDAYCIGRMIPAASNPTTAVTGGCTEAGDELIVTVSYIYPFIVFPNLASFFGGSFGSTLTMTAVTRMRCE